MATVATGTRSLQKSSFFSKMALLKLKNPERIATYLFLQLLTSLNKSSLVFYSQ
jgi:hypothetical protein